MRSAKGNNYNITHLDKRQRLSFCEGNPSTGMTHVITSRSMHTCRNSVQAVCLVCSLRFQKPFSCLCAHLSLARYRTRKYCLGVAGGELCHLDSVTVVLRLRRLTRPCLPNFYHVGVRSRCVIVGSDTILTCPCPMACEVFRFLIGNFFFLN